MLVTSLPVPQWLERPTGVWKVMGSIPVRDSEFSFVARSWYHEYNIFLLYSPGLKFTTFSYLSINRTLSTSLILAISRKRVTMNLLNGSLRV